MSRSFVAPAKFSVCADYTYAWKPSAISSFLTDYTVADNLIAATASTLADDVEDFDTVTPGVTYTGEIQTPDDDDLLVLNVTAGQTYSISLHSAPVNGMTDPLLILYNQAGTLVNYDDDGGVGINSFLTFTADYTGVYYIDALDFGGGIGAYTVDVTQESSQADIADTFVDAQLITAGDTVFSFIDSQAGTVYTGLGEVDTFKITLEAGKYYTFQVAGGADYETDAADVPAGELDTVMILYDSDGNRLLLNDDNNYPSDISSGLSFYATKSGTYYIDVAAYAGQTGGYTLETQEIDFTSLDPLDSIDWVNAANIPTNNNVATVYFAVEGENFGELADDGTSPLESYGWNSYEKQQLLDALKEYTKITGITYVETTSATNATFRVITTTSEEYGAYFYPRDPSYGTQQGIGAFNVDSGGWSLEENGIQPSLQQGGYAYAVMLHEFGHAHGLAHPHDNGGGSDVMVGVTGATGSLGIFDLNQGVYTVMSYNDAWETHPDGGTPFTRAQIGNGWSGTLSAFDIAKLQERYGVHAYATGSNVYTLKDVQATGTYYETIWDTGGYDEIKYSGSKDARIDLIAATLDYSPTGGGVVSFVDGIWGGYTIANGVVIEKATGGSGNDVLLGNAADNVITGNVGNDYIDGREGRDVVLGGEGNDQVVYDAADSTVQGGAGVDTLVVKTAANVDLGQFSTTQVAGKSVFGFENVDASASTVSVTVTGSQYNNTISGGAAADILSAGGGTDVVHGNGGNDVIDGGTGRDSLYGDAGNDRITYDAIDYTITGGTGTDTLVVNSALTIDLSKFSTTQVVGQSVWGFENVDGTSALGELSVAGSNFANLIIGGSAGDTLAGGGGLDTLTGGLGADKFVFGQSAVNNGYGKITDFVRGQGDKIDLSGIDAVTGGGDNAFAFIGGSAFHNVAGELRSVTAGANQYVEGDLNGDGAADFKLYVTTPDKLLALDFVL
ncbi:M10 family metallopeptidase C-terminal domain-containing protein [Sphingomonas sp. ID0503]|uniref:M10 family metallopeptidase C-terminal domain-containing protein n=1 Tax=Sphingomonas sp. ID0503 TaxID=3399691 RepID=UPI003AFB701A